MRLRLIFCILLLGNSVGCSTLSPTPVRFDQLGKFNQYSLNQNIFKINFKAYHRVSYATGQEIALVYAAQTTLGQGFRYFKALNDPTNQNTPPKQTVIYQHTPPIMPLNHRGMFWNPAWNQTSEFVVIDPVEISYTIECFKQEQQHPNDVFDAQLILQNLGSKYGIVTTPYTP